MALLSITMISSAALVLVVALTLAVDARCVRESAGAEQRFATLEDADPETSAALRWSVDGAPSRYEYCRQRRSAAAEEPHHPVTKLHADGKKEVPAPVEAAKSSKAPAKTEEVVKTKDVTTKKEEGKLEPKPEPESDESDIAVTFDSGAPVGVPEDEDLPSHVPLFSEHVKGNAASKVNPILLMDKLESWSPEPDEEEPEIDGDVVATLAESTSAPESKVAVQQEKGSDGEASPVKKDSKDNEKKATEAAKPSKEKETVKKAEQTQS